MDESDVDPDPFRQLVVWFEEARAAGVELPEAAVLRRWGGEAVVLPYEEGRSTTGLIAQAGGRHAA